MLGATFSLHATHHQTVQRKERIASHQSVRHSRNATVAGNCTVHELHIVPYFLCTLQIRGVMYTTSSAYFRCFYVILQKRVEQHAIQISIIDILTNKFHL